jgi:hypothetical protein
MMVEIFASNETIDRDELLRRLRGGHAKECLDKIERMDGRIVAIDFSHGQWPDGHGEHILFEMGVPGDFGFGSLRTDDQCVSWGIQPRWANREELIADVTRHHEHWHLDQAKKAEEARAGTTNLVSATS